MLDGAIGSQFVKLIEALTVCMMPGMPNIPSRTLRLVSRFIAIALIVFPNGCARKLRLTPRTGSGSPENIVCVR